MLRVTNPRHPAIATKRTQNDPRRPTTNQTAARHDPAGTCTGDQVRARYGQIVRDRQTHDHHQGGKGDSKPCQKGREMIIQRSPRFLPFFLLLFSLARGGRSSSNRNTGKQEMRYTLPPPIKEPLSVRILSVLMAGIFAAFIAAAVYVYATGLGTLFANFWR